MLRFLNSNLTPIHSDELVIRFSSDGYPGFYNEFEVRFEKQAFRATSSRIKAPSKSSRVPTERIEKRILLIRSHKVLLDTDLATLYDVETRALVQAVKRNLERFPADFMFQLAPEEQDSLRSQSVISNKSGRGGRRYAPYAFTEQGVAMLSSVLSSPRAISVNIEVMRAFVRLRELIASNKELAKCLDELEARIEAKVTTYDQAIAGILNAIRALMAPPEPSGKRPIGFIQTG